MDADYLRRIKTNIESGTGFSVPKQACREVMAYIEDLESDRLRRILPKVWELKIAGRSIVLRYENESMSAVATLQSDDEVAEEFELDRIDQRKDTP